MKRGLALALTVWFLAGILPKSAAQKIPPTVSPPPPSELPEDWPPVPDFRNRIDYVTWWESRRRVDPQENAAGLWEAITYPMEGSVEEQAANDRLWGRIDHDEGISGMFFSDEEDLEHWAWDPAEHPEWEKAYQLRKEGGLHERLREIAVRPYSFGKLIPFHPPSTESDGKPADWGLTGEERLPGLYLLPSLAVNRSAVRVLVSDSWRAPEGRVDAEAMIESFQTCLMIGHQTDRDDTTIGSLVGMSCRRLTYENILKALEESMLDASGTVELQKWMAKHDNEPLDPLRTQGLELANLFAVLQYAYACSDDRDCENPDPVVSHIERLMKFLAASQETAPDLYKELPPNLEDWLNSYEPREVLLNTIRTQLRIRDAVKAESPQATRQAYLEFANAVDKDALFQSWCPVHPRFYELMIQAETARRAVHCILAIHRYKRERGEWPKTLTHAGRYVPRNMRLDPFSGRPFVYELTEQGVRLYSVSWDGSDHGGSHDRDWGHRYDEDKGAYFTDCDHVFWPVRKE